MDSYFGSNLQYLWEQICPSGYCEEYSAACQWPLGWVGGVAGCSGGVSRGWPVGLGGRGKFWWGWDVLAWVCVRGMPGGKKGLWDKEMRN